MERKSFFHWVEAHRSLIGFIFCIVSIIIGALSAYIYYITYEDEEENVVYIKPDIEKLTTMANEICEKYSLNSIRAINNENEEYKFIINATTDSTRIEIYSKIDRSKLIEFLVNKAEDKLKIIDVKPETQLFTKRQSSTIVMAMTVLIASLTLSTVAIFILENYLIYKRRKCNMQ